MCFPRIFLSVGYALNASKIENRNLKMASGPSNRTLDGRFQIFISGRSAAL